MATLILKGTIKAIGPVEYVGANRLAKQTVILFVAGYTDEFGDKRGNDEEWELQALGDKIPTFALSPDKVGKKVTCKVFANSKRVVSTDATKQDMFIVNITLNSYDLMP